MAMENEILQPKVQEYAISKKKSGVLIEFYMAWHNNKNQYRHLKFGMGMYILLLWAIVMSSLISLIFIILLNVTDELSLWRIEETLITISTQVGIQGTYIAKDISFLNLVTLLLLP